MNESFHNFVRVKYFILTNVPARSGKSAFYDETLNEVAQIRVEVPRWHIS